MVFKLVVGIFIFTRSVFFTSSKFVNKAKKYSDDQYGIGNGVPPDKMDEYIEHFLPHYKVGTLVSDLSQASRRKAIVSFGRRNDNGKYDPSWTCCDFSKL